MRILAVFEQAVTVLILSLMVLSFLMGIVNCIVPESKTVQTARMEPTLQLFRAFDLNPVTLSRHNADLEQQSRIEFERQARGEQ